MTDWAQRPDAAASSITEAAAWVTIPTADLSGRSGCLDFKFVSLESVVAPAELCVSVFGVHGGELGRVVETVGIVSGELSFDHKLVLVNTPEQHASEYSIGIRFGHQITFRFAFARGHSECQGRAFGFSLLDADGSDPLLLVSDWQVLDPSGLAFLADMDNDELRISSFLKNGSVREAR